MLSSAFDIISVAHKASLPVVQVGQVYFALGERLRLGSLRSAASGIATVTHFERLAVQALIGDLYDEQRRLTLSVIEGKRELAGWEKANADALGRTDRQLEELGAEADIPRLMVALRQIRGL